MRLNTKIWHVFILVAISCVACSVQLPQKPGRYKDIGIQFTETMSGYFDKGDLPYDKAYKQGQQKNQKISFTLTATVPSINNFVNDREHPIEAKGRVSISGMTNLATVSNAVIDVFPNGVVDNAIYLYYYFAFVASDGKPYHLEGVKIVNGSECLESLEPMLTTLYTHIRTGTVRGQGSIVATGIVTLGPLDILNFVLSVQFLGNGTDADKTNAIVLIVELLGGTLESDCFNINAFANYFWYIWMSDGNNGFLLDMIKRPTTLELRLDLYNNTPGVVPIVTKQFLPLEKFNESLNGTITMGPLVLTPSNCKGTVNSYVLDVAFTLNGRINHFYPESIAERFDFFPAVTSHYGTYTKGSVAGVSYEPGLPLTYTTYPVPFAMGWWKWVMFSAPNFAGTDLQVEMVATQISGYYIGFSYVYYQGKEYHLNDPFLFETRLTHTGEVQNNERIFGAELQQIFSIHISVICRAPLDKFVIIEQEGNTIIQTSLLGTCTAVDKKNNKTFVAKGALLEIKA